MTVKSKLDLYAEVPSMNGIYQDCKELIVQVEEKLFERLTTPIISSDDLIETIQLLKQLGVSEIKLESIMVEMWTAQIEADLLILRNNDFVDILEFVENGCCNFLTTLSMFANLYPQLFEQQNSRIFTKIMNDFLTEFETVVNQRFCNETNGRECALYVRALDKIYRKLAACDRLIFCKFTVYKNYVVNVCKKSVKTK